MPSRKRNLSPDSNTHISTNSSSTQEPAKRLKFTSDRPGNPSGASAQKHKNSTVVSEPEYYTIKSILKEKRGRYLIDWEDDPATGEQFKPTWEPKGYANAEAVADWQRRRSTRKGPNKRRTATTSVSSISAASKSGSPVTRRRKGRKVVNTPPTQSTAPSQDWSPRQEALEVKDSQPTQPPPPPSEYLAVQVSQHSSFDRDQYVQFLASCSTQDLSSQLQHQDSGLGSSSPLQETLPERVIGYEERIVPDSQSLPEPQTVYKHHQPNPLFSPCPEETVDSSRVKEGDNQVGGEDSSITAPGVLDPRTTYNYHQTSPLFSPCPETIDSSKAKEGDNEVGDKDLSIAGARTPPAQVSDLITNSPGVPDLHTAYNFHQTSPLFSPCPEASDYGQGQDDITSGLGFQTQVALSPDQDSQKQPEWGSARHQVIFDIPQDDLSAPELWQTASEVRQDIPLPSIESDTPELSNSQILPAPSQLPGSFDSKAPGPPCSLSTDNDTMAERPQPLTSANAAPAPASSQSSGVRVSLRERLKDMRARSAARLKAEKAVRRAEYEKRVAAIRSRRTSIVPDPFTRAPEENGNPKLVEPALKTRVADDVAELSSQHFSGPPSFGHPQLGKMEYAIPLPLDSRISEQYKQALYNHRHEIEEFVQREAGEDSRLVDHMRAMIERVITLTIHSDLSNLMVMSQEQIDEIDQAHWAKTCSGKFEFLGGFIAAARATDMHVVVLTSRTKLLDILETFLKAYHAVYVRPDVMRRSDAAAEGPLRFTLLATADTSSIVSTAALVIAFDESVNTQDPRVTALRAHMLEVGKLSPLIHLLVVNSAEHIEKCLPSSLTGVYRLQALVSCVAQTRHKVGQLPLEMPRPCGAAEEVVVFLSLGGGEGQWMLPGMPKLVDIELFESSSTAGSSTQSVSQRSTNRKRSMDLDDDYYDTYDTPVAKRARLTPVQDITHISDSITQPSQPGPSKVDELQKALKAAEVQLEILKAHHASCEAELQNTVTSTQQRLQEHVDALSDLQYRYETQSIDLHTLRSERDAAAAATSLAHRHLDTQRVEIDKLKEKQRVLETDLKDARSVSMSSTVPEVAALESAKAEISQLAADKAQMEKRLVSQTKDFEFTRQQYQLASTAAAENASALFDLQTEVSTLKVRASGEAARLRQLNMSTENQAHLERARQLEATLRDRDEMLKKKEEELRDLKRGKGLATRASSAPRSPRLGSRASSPMPGLLAGSAGRGGSALRFGS